MTFSGISKLTSGWLPLNTSQLLEGLLQAGEFSESKILAWLSILHFELNGNCRENWMTCKLHRCILWFLFLILTDSFLEWIMFLSICFWALQPIQFSVWAEPWYAYSTSYYDTQQDFFQHFWKQTCGSRNSLSNVCIFYKNFLKEISVTAFSLRL